MRCGVDVGTYGSSVSGEVYVDVVALRMTCKLERINENASRIDQLGL